MVEYDVARQNMADFVIYPVHKGPHLPTGIHEKYIFVMIERRRFFRGSGLLYKIWRPKLFFQRRTSYHFEAQELKSLRAFEIF